MKRADYEVQVKPSLFDRLIDLNPGSPRDPLPTRQESVAGFRAGVVRDLENLLNTRNTLPGLPSGFTEVPRSVLAYGLPDFSNLNINNPHDRLRLRQLIENTIRQFEPRLTGVVVAVMPTQEAERCLKFRIEANLWLDPTPEPVEFDMIMQLDNLRYEIREGG